MSVLQIRTDERFERPVAAPSETGFDLLREIVAALMRRWLWIAASVVVAAACALAFLALTRPLYSANTQILIDPRAKQVLQTEVVPSGLGSSAVGADTLLVDSQVEIILSDAVLKAVIAREGLANDPEFASGRRTSLSGLLVGVGLSPSDEPIAAPPLARVNEADAMEALRRKLRVRRAGNTYVIDVAVRSHDPEKAARISDAIATAYLQEERKATQSSTHQTTTMLTGRLDDLRQRVNTAEGRVEAYREKHGLIGINNVLVSEQQLRDLNERLTTARTRSSETRVKYEHLAALARRGAAGVDAMTEALGSLTISTLRVAHGDAVRQLANAATMLGNRHPTIRMLEAERDQIARTIEAELARLARNARQEYDFALAHERSVSAQVDRLQDRAGVSNRALVALRELEREAEAARTVYQAFLTRTRQTAEQEQISTSNARILASASIPTRHVYPKAFLVLAAALAIGFMLGCLIAWLRDLTARNRRPAFG